MALLGADRDVMSVLCECGSDDCDEEMTLPREAYRNIRLNGNLFVVRIGYVCVEMADWDASSQGRTRAARNRAAAHLT